MITLPQTLRCWDTPAFETTLKSEIQQLEAGSLPLQQCLTQSSYAEGGNLDVLLLTCHEDTHSIHAKTGIFFEGRIPGCACDDDPTPESRYTEYCVLDFCIDKNTASTQITILTNE